MSVLGELFDFDWQVHEGGYEPGRRMDKTGGVEMPLEVLQAKPRASSMPYLFEGKHDGLFRRFASLEQTPEDAAEFASEFGLLRQPNVDWEPLDIWYRAIGVMQALVAELDAGRHEAVYDLFNRRDYIRPRFSAAIRYNPAKRGLRVPFKTDFKLVPESLLAVMWLQFANQATKGTEFKQCEMCPNWFGVGPSTGRKPSKRFCSSRCRIAAHRLKTTEV